MPDRRFNASGLVSVQTVYRCYQQTGNGVVTSRKSLYLAGSELMNMLLYRLLIFFQYQLLQKKKNISTFSKKYFRTTIRVSNSLDRDQTRRFKASDLVSVQTVCRGYQQTGKSSIAGRASI